MVYIILKKIIMIIESYSRNLNIENLFKSANVINSTLFILQKIL